MFPYIFQIVLWSICLTPLGKHSLSPPYILEVLSDYQPARQLCWHAFFCSCPISLEFFWTRPLFCFRTRLLWVSLKDHTFLLCLYHTARFIAIEWLQFTRGTIWIPYCIALHCIMMHMHELGADFVGWVHSDEWSCWTTRSWWQRNCHSHGGWKDESISWQTDYQGQIIVPLFHFYHAMHYSAKCDPAIAWHLSVCLSVCPSVCNIGGSWPHRLKILETNCTNN